MVNQLKTLDIDRIEQIKLNNEKKKWMFVLAYQQVKVEFVKTDFSSQLKKKKKKITDDFRFVNSSIKCSI